MLDTSVLIAIQRGEVTEDVAAMSEDDVAIAAVTAAELLLGVELAPDHLQPAKRSAVERLLQAVAVDDYDLDVARHHAVLLAHVRQSGRPRGGHDLLIAATALAARRTIVTKDARGFDGLPGVAVRSVT